MLGRQPFLTSLLPCTRCAVKGPVGTKLHLHRETVYLQVVAAVQGRLLSIYDGSTQYKLGQTLHAKRGGAAWAPLDACYFGFPSMQQVRVTPHGLESNKQ